MKGRGERRGGAEGKAIKKKSEKNNTYIRIYPPKGEDMPPPLKDM
jgi:hypothetical protein